MDRILASALHKQGSVNPGVSSLSMNNQDLEGSIKEQSPEESNNLAVAELVNKKRLLFITLKVLKEKNESLHHFSEARFFYLWELPLSTSPRSVRT